MASPKDALRSTVSATRRARTDADRDTARAAVRTVVLQRCRARGWQCVAAYVPLRSEPGSLELLDDLVSQGVAVLVPLLLPDRDLDWVAWPGKRPLGREAINRADAVLVPALAVASSDGTRLGRGGGSYDRALPRCRPGAEVAALLFADELVTSLPRDDWDVAVSAVASPAGWTAVGTSTRNTGGTPTGWQS